MSMADSNLSPTGFDYVLAVTQDSINGALKKYLYGGTLPEVVLCYVYDANDMPYSVDFNTFVAGANNTDPFTVPAGTPSSDPRLQNLITAKFAFAIKAKLGLPPGVPRASLPTIIALNPGQSNVTYTLTFSEFVATEFLFPTTRWVNQSQPSGTTWSFSGAVDLNFQDADFTNLPAAVQARIKALGDPSLFSVQQLYYDLNSADLEQSFQFDGVPGNSTLSTFMTADFINIYWKALGGQEILGYGAKQTQNVSPSGITVTDLNFFTPRAMGAEGAPLTLNYLCATNGRTLPGTTSAGFGWNWIEPGEASQYSGVAALNRKVLVQYFDTQLKAIGADKRNCYRPWVRVSNSEAGLKINFYWAVYPGQTPTYNYPQTGAILLNYHFDGAKVEDDTESDIAELDMTTSFDLTVSVQDSTIVITQHLTIWMYVKNFPGSDSGNLVDKTITDTYSVGVINGALAISAPASVTKDHSQIPSGDGFLNFFSDVDSLANDAVSWAQGISATSLTDIPAAAIQSFIFPGGSTFAFADACFSANQDLVAHITYAGTVSS